MQKLVMAVLIPCGVAMAQTPVEVGRVYDGTLGEGETYTLALDGDTFVRGVADQISVDVIVRIHDPGGDVIANVDGPGIGPERFQFNADDAGEYRIEILPFEEATGAFTFLIESAEPIATDGPGRTDQLFSAYDHEDVPGGVVGVVRGGDLVFAKAYGAANLTYDIPFTVQTRSNIGSTSKQFTAMAICLLAQQGKLSLDDDIRQHVPELPDLGQTVTIRHLLTHTSGYREFLNLLAMSGRSLGEGDWIDRDEMIGIIQRQPALQNDPGSEWNYNNTGYALMTIVVENVTGQPFAEWMDENVFTPLGMDNTFVRAHRADIVANSAMGYLPSEGDTYRMATDLGGAMGAGGMYTTVGDMALWIGNLLSPTLGGEDVIEEMSTPYELTDGESTSYGLGLFIGELRGLKMIQHGGADTAHRCLLLVFPEIDAGVVVMSNNASFNSGVASEIAEVFFGDHMTADEPEDDVGATEPSGFDPEAYDAESFDVFAGRYEMEEMKGFIIEFTREDDQIFIQATGQPKLGLVPTGHNTFKLTVVEASVEFHLGDDGTCSSLTLHQNGEHAATRLEEEPWAPSGEQLAAYAGRYFSEELETYYDLVVEEDTLKIKHRRFESTLTPREEHAFGAGFPVAVIEFEVNEGGEVTSFMASNGRSRDIRFERVE